MVLKVLSHFKGTLDVVFVFVSIFESFYLDLLCPKRIRIDEPSKLQRDFGEEYELLWVRNICTMDPCDGSLPQRAVWRASQIRELVTFSFPLFTLCSSPSHLVMDHPVTNGFDDMRDGGSGRSSA